MRTIPELSIDSKLIYEKLVSLNPGESITYQSLNELIGRDVQNGARGNLVTAKKQLLNEGVVIETIRNVGVKRLKDAEIAFSGEYAIKKARRAIQKGSKKLICVKDFDSMPQDAQLKHNFSLSVLGALEMITKPQSIKKIEHKIAEEGVKIAAGKTLELFR